MPVSDILKIGYLKYVLFLAGLILAASCVTQGLDECPPGPGPDPGPGEPVSRLLYLRVTDEVPTRSDISDTEDLDDIMVYLFDRNEKLLDTIPYTTAMIRQRIPVDLTGMDMEGGYVTVWANLGNSIDNSPVTIGVDIYELEVAMMANASRADFFLCPGDMFFGYKQVEFTPVDETTEADTVWLARKNSRLNITVRGLTDVGNAADYYFRIGSIYSAYNYEGTPQAVPREIWEEGIFNSGKDYVSPEPYIMIHNAVDHVYSETSRILVELYRVGETRADTFVVSGDRADNGDYIRLEQGKTTNVLIAIDAPTGEISIDMVVTPWEEIHQWTIW